MPKFGRIMQAIAALVLLMSLAVSPVTDAMTHGPGTLVVEAEHAAFHAARGEHQSTVGHTHHDASDHDHASPAILESRDETFVRVAEPVEISKLRQMTGVTCGGPRRPPRDTDLTT
ncbi:MAG: hypothetical protein A2092_06400 [Rhodobacteraceae bacterium GWE1_64_9]|nr:MAG: hypothetical protein A2092_06400 [Rhodobacteraceae bacterium GWE1_64_9]OHC51147.1 MAG: hypothetical protein A2X69_20075 [Rhodobacteraceae bacterium GWF1_65_7]HBD91948.1 hypothetical protein [Gemmobacter sp.]HBU14337.1 hypothetical protein [Gemmobacter sp.]